MPVDTPNSPYVTWDPKEFEKEIALLLAVSSTKTYKNGEMIYLQGEKSRAFFFVKKGKVKVSILKENGSEKILAIQEENTFFGESAAFDGHPYFATAFSVGDSEIGIIPIDRAKMVIRTNPDVAFMIISRIIRKLRLLGFQVEDFAFLEKDRPHSGKTDDRGARNLPGRHRNKERDHPRRPGQSHRSFESQGHHDSQ